ncbi:MAG: hypothetical protein NTZ47_05920, partial [Bacteroidetes bacterium]|nr:hypothetical protein [Bacteroidota bacterium]
MSKRINISPLLTRGYAGIFRAFIMVLAGIVLSLSVQAQYSGGSGGGSSNGDGYIDYCTPVIGAKLVTTCSGVTFSVSPTDGVDGDVVPGSTYYSWSAPTAISGISGLTGASGAATFFATLSNTTSAPVDVVYIVTPATLSCTGATFTVTVTVYPAATVNNISLTACSGVTFAVTPSSGNIPTGISYTWNAPTFTGTVTGGNSGSGTNITGTLTNGTASSQTVTYFVTPSVPGGCSTAGFTITITLLPRATMNVASLTTCSGILFNYTPTGTIVPSGTTYSWNAPSTDGTSAGLGGSNASSFSGTLTNTTTTVGTATYFVTPTVPGGCSSAGFTVTVSVFPVANISSTSLTTCTGVLFQYTPTGTPAPIGTTYTWNAPSTDGTSAGLGGS